MRRTMMLILAGLAASTGAAQAQSRSPDGPQACPRIYAPVCGADGRTYTNTCEARVAGVGVVSNGTCQATVRQMPPCATNGSGCTGGSVARHPGAPS